MKIKNVVFDIGNVLVRWAPLEVIKTSFPEFEPEDFYHKMRPIWIDFNLGKFTEDEAISHYQRSLDLPKERLANFMFALKRHQTPLEGSIELLDKLQKLEINLFSITDNIREFIDYHRKVSEFPKYFKDIIVSSDIGVLKPDNRIYQHLLDKHHLNPRACDQLDCI